MKKKLIALGLTMSLSAGLMVACTASKSEPTTVAKSEEAQVTEAKEEEKTEESAELPTITFVHGYYQSVDEWPVAQEMRNIYEDFAKMNKDRVNFVIKADETGAEGIYNTGLNMVASGDFYDIADFGGWNITEAAAGAGLLVDLKPELDKDADFKAGVGIGYAQGLVDGKIYTVREQVEGVGFWYNEDLFNQAGADTPDKWSTWADFDTAVDKLKEAGIEPFGLNAGWPSSILTAGYFQRSKDSRDVYALGTSITDTTVPGFKDTVDFMQNKALAKIEDTNFGPGGEDDNAYIEAFTSGEVAMLFNGVWAASDVAKLGEAGKPAIFPTDEAGKKAALLSSGGGLMVSSKLDDVQKEIAIDFVKYMTSKETAQRIISAGIGMAPNESVDFEELAKTTTSLESKLLVDACKKLQEADYKALGLGNNFGDLEGEYLSKLPELKSMTKDASEVTEELNAFIKAQ